MSQNARSGNPPCDKPTCSNCGRKHWGECLVVIGNFTGCVKEGHDVKDLTNMRSQEKRRGEALIK